MIITVNEELGVVVAESKTKHGLSVCCPEDKFDLALGIKLAKERMVPRDVGAWGLGNSVLTGSRPFFIRQREIHRRYLAGAKLDRVKTAPRSHVKYRRSGFTTAGSFTEALNDLARMTPEFTESPKSEPAATPPAEPSAPAAPNSQSHVTLTSGEYLRLLALAKRAEVSRGTEPADTRRPRDK